MKRQRCSDDRELTKTVLQELLVPLCTVTIVHNTVAQTVLLIFAFLQTNITSQMWRSGGKCY